MVWLTTAWKMEAERSSFVAPSLIRGWISDLCENAAAGGNGVKGFIIFRVFIQAGGIRLKKGSHLVDKGTGTAGTDTVHTLLHISAFKVDDLRVLTAELDGYVRLGSVMLQGCGYGNDFLNKRNPEVFGQGQSAGTGDHGMNGRVPLRRRGLFSEEKKESPGCWRNAAHNQKRADFFLRPGSRSSQ